MQRAPANRDGAAARETTALEQLKFQQRSRRALRCTMLRTLMKATLLIRRAGLRGRMQPPEAFLRRMNRWSMEMTQQTRRAGGKEGRKRVLRQMKRWVGVVRGQRFGGRIPAADSLPLRQFTGRPARCDNCREEPGGKDPNARLESGFHGKCEGLI